MTLRGATALGPATLDGLHAIAGALARDGIELGITQEATHSSAELLDRLDDLDLVWMCGALFAGTRRTRGASHEAILAPVFDGESTAVYHSVLIARVDGPIDVDEACRGRLAVNEVVSWSGHHALRRHLGDRWFADEIETGAHVASIDAVRSGLADCASIDSSVWRASGATGDETLRVLTTTADHPAPPLVVRADLADDIVHRLVDTLTGITDVPGVRHFLPAASDDYAHMI